MAISRALAIGQQLSIIRQEFKKMLPIFIDVFPDNVSKKKKCFFPRVFLYFLFIYFLFCFVLVLDPGVF